MVYTFRGGIHPGPHSDPGYKAATNTKPIELLPVPDQVILPVSMHIGAPAKPIVQVGDTVEVVTMTGRRETGVLCEVNPGYTHTYGQFVPELHQIQTQLRQLVFGGEQ